MVKPVLVLAAVALLGAAAFSIRWHDGSSDQGDVAPAIPPTQDVVEEQPVEALKPTTAKFAIANPDALSEEEKWKAFPLRDGTWVPTLNGVTLSNHSIPGGMSKTPIVAIEHNPATGYDYYLHEDGSKTYTIPVKNLVTGETKGAMLIEGPPDDRLKMDKINHGDPKPMPADRNVTRPPRDGR